jgi:thiamine-phosphate pyrophosphorylase
MFNQVLDANINRVSEGLRVIEEYTRFVWKEKELTQALAQLRKRINTVLPQSNDLLHIRDIEKDMRAKEVPVERKSLKDLLVANFKRVQEGLRVLEEYTGNSIFNECRYDAYQLEKQVILPLSKGEKLKGIYLISSEIDVLKQGIEWGVPLIQFRDKYASKDVLYNKSKEMMDLARGTGTKFIVNDFIDIAMLIDADGLHTGQDDLDVGLLRSILGDHKLLGRTTHTIEQGLLAQDQGSDYVSVGPLWETPSKPGRAGIGFDYLSKAADVLTIPYVAIGGIDSSRIEQVMTYSPPLVGLIRDYQHVPHFQSLFK